LDTLTKEKRSWNMSRIRSKDTKPEIAVRSMLHRSGYRFRLHVKNLPGKPDIVLPKYNTVIFVNGCFWHRHQGCKYSYNPKTHVQFWRKKFKDNVVRQKAIIKKLNNLGWKVKIVWECETSRENYISQLTKLLHS
jgi:DNA mismatch endonuclease, patch repair protein